MSISSNKSLVAGQIGCGKFSQAQDFPNMTNHPQVNLKWCCDLDYDSANEKSKKFNVPHVSSDFNDIINDPEVDFIKIATSHEVHLPIIEAAAKAGKHIFCEKPLAMDNEEALKIIKAVKSGGIKLCVDYNRRQAPALRALKKRFLQQWKNPQHQEWRYLESPRESLPEEDQAHFTIMIQDESASYAMGHLDPLRGGGTIIGESVHWLDLACHFFAPQIPVEIMAWGSRRLSHGINLKFSKGDTATIIFNTSGTFDYPKEVYQIAAKASLLRSIFFVENEYYGIPDASNETFAMQFDSMNGEISEDGFAGYMKKYKLLAERSGNNYKTYENANPFRVDKGHKHMLNAFVDSILNDKPSPCNEIDGYRATLLAKYAMQSLDCRQALPVPTELFTPVFV
jgi:predicted dehydrogenase